MELSVTVLLGTSGYMAAQEIQTRWLGTSCGGTGVWAFTVGNSAPIEVEIEINDVNDKFMVALGV